MQLEQDLLSAMASLVLKKFRRASLDPLVELCDETDFFRVAFLGEREPRDSPIGTFLRLPEQPGDHMVVGVVVPCYTEDADSLDRTLQSLAIQQIELIQAYGEEQ